MNNACSVSTYICSYFAEHCTFLGVVLHAEMHREALKRSAVRSVLVAYEKSTHGFYVNNVDISNGQFICENSTFFFVVVTLKFGVFSPCENLFWCTHEIPVEYDEVVRRRWYL